MTEVPEHLLKKAAEARARLTGQGDAAASDNEPAAAAPAALVPAAAPAPVAATAAEPEPVRDPPEVEAAKARKTIPYWVMPVLLFIPVWAIYYVGYLENPPVTGGLAFEGEEVYSQCAGCHGGGGGGGTGRRLNEGQVTLTFPPGDATSGYDGLAGHIAWVANGTEGTRANEGGSTYGDPDRAGGAQIFAGENGAMGSFGSLGVEELVAVVFHERSQFGDLEPDVVIEELELLEEYIHIVEEVGVTSLDGVTYAEVHGLLEEARTKLGGSGTAEE